MGYKISDERLWDELKLTVSNEKNIHIRETPKRLHVVRAIVPKLDNVLDLHGQTIQQAFDSTVNFLSKHYIAATREVLIVTGRGTMGQGLIKKEFDGWLKHPKIRRYVRSTLWQNKGGAVKVVLKKNVF